VPLYVGFDAREAVGYHAFLQSVVETSPGVSVTALSGALRGGTNAFTLERFTVMERLHWGSSALFVDGCDMLARADLGGLWALRDEAYAVQVVKHEYVPRAGRKYLGTPMESANAAYPRKNWSSVMIVNAGHWANFDGRERVAEAIERGDGAFLHRFGWLRDEQIGELPAVWNWLDEYGENADAKLLHWTNGIPAFHAYREAPHADEWRAVLRRAQRGLD
jgi:hypothetical protein